MTWVKMKIVFLFCSILFAYPMGNSYGQVPTGTISFKKHTLTNDFVSEGAAVGDVNNDGKIDVIAGAYWFEAPDGKGMRLNRANHLTPAGVQ